MMNSTLVQLVTIAREAGVKGYSTMKKAQLINAIELAKSNKEMGDVNMTTNNNSVMVSVDDMVAQLKGIMNIASKSIVSKVNTHSTVVGDAIMLQAKNNGMKIDARLTAIESKIDALAVKPVYQAPAKNPTTTIKQYNKDAAELKEVGQVLNVKTGKMVNYYGVCATCGTKVTSPNVVAYANLNNKGVCVCYSCQSKAKIAAKATEKKASTIKAPIAEGVSEVIVKKCSYCSTKISYRNHDHMKDVTRRAQIAGLKPFCCMACAKEILATETSVPVVAPVEIIEEQTTFAPVNPTQNSTISNEENQGF